MDNPLSWFIFRSVCFVTFELSALCTRCFLLMKNVQREEARINRSEFVVSWWRFSHPIRKYLLLSVYTRSTTFLVEYLSLIWMAWLCAYNMGVWCVSNKYGELLHIQSSDFLVNDVCVWERELGSMKEEIASDWTVESCRPRETASEYLSVENWRCGKNYKSISKHFCSIKYDGVRAKVLPVFQHRVPQIKGNKVIIWTIK